MCKADFKRAGMSPWWAGKGEAGNHYSWFTCDSLLVFNLAYFRVCTKTQPSHADWFWLCPRRELTVCAMVLAYVSAIQDISLSPVLMSGAGTSMPGPGEESQVGEEVREKWESCVKHASHCATLQILYILFFFKVHGYVGKNTDWDAGGNVSTRLCALVSLVSWNKVQKQQQACREMGEGTTARKKDD